MEKRVLEVAGEGRSVKKAGDDEMGSALNQRRE
jgi:hypothetical protein